MKWTREAIEQEALKYDTKKLFKASNGSAYNAAARLGILDAICSHMRVIKGLAHIKWNRSSILEEAKKYQHRKDFKKQNQTAYAAACKLEILDEACSHMITLWEKKWDRESVIAEAKKYKHKGQFWKLSYGAAKFASENDIKEAFDHMERAPNPNQKWTKETITKVASEFIHKSALEKQYPGLVAAVKSLQIGPEVFAHLTPLWEKKWNADSIKQTATSFATRVEFERAHGSAAAAARKLNILDEVCKHMKESANESIPERELMEVVRNLYPKAHKFKDRKINIPDKPHIQGLDIDIYIPELRKGIEFDGKYWHSAAGLKRGRPHWPDDDLENYHKIKDAHFKAKGIELLHIDEKDWLKDRENCIKLILNFLK